MKIDIENGGLFVDGQTPLNQANLNYMLGLAREGDSQGGGPQGRNVFVHNTALANATAFDAAGIRIGDFVVAGVNNINFMGVTRPLGSVWERTAIHTLTARGNIQGPQGNQGIQGPAGQRGLDGIQGPTGPSLSLREIIFRMEFTNNNNRISFSCYVPLGINAPGTNQNAVASWLRARGYDSDTRFCPARGVNGTLTSGGSHIIGVFSSNGSTISVVSARDTDNNPGFVSCTVTIRNV